MIKNIQNIALVTALFGTVAIAGEIESNPNVKVSGDVEVSYKSEKAGSNKDTFNETTVGINIDAALSDGVKIYTRFKAYDGVQAGLADTDNEADSGMATEYAYATIPLMDKKINLTAGLIPNEVFGTDAFDDGGESWSTLAKLSMVKNLNINIASKKNKENSTDGSQNDEGDENVFGFGLDYTIDDFVVGLKSETVKFDADDNNISDGIKNEKNHKVLNAYITGAVAGWDVGFEYMKKSSDINNDYTDDNMRSIKGNGYHLNISKEDIIEGLSAGLAYTKVSKGLDIGKDYEAGAISFGDEELADTIRSTENKDATIIALPISYAIDDKWELGVTLLSGKNAYYEDPTDLTSTQKTKSFSETNIGVTYAFSEATSVNFAYENRSAIEDGGEKQTNMSATIAIAF